MFIGHVYLRHDARYYLLKNLQLLSEADLTCPSCEWLGSTLDIELDC